MFRSNKISLKNILFSLLVIMICLVFTGCSSQLSGESASLSKEDESSGQIEKAIEEVVETEEIVQEDQKSEKNSSSKETEEYDSQEKDVLYADDNQSNSSSEAESMSSGWDGVYTDGNTIIIIVYGGSRVCIVQNDTSYFVDNMEEDITDNYIFSIMDDPEYEYHAEHTFSLNGDSLAYKEAIRVEEAYWGSDEDLTVVIDGVFNKNNKDANELFDYYKNEQ